MYSHTKILMLLALSFTAEQAVAQTVAGNPNQQTVLGKGPFTSPRATAMGGAISTVADDLDATFSNPAGIGGLGMGSGKMPWVRKLYFPQSSASANENTKSLNTAFKEQNGADDSAIGQSILDASEGDRQFARANAVMGVVIGRAILVPFTDYQVAALAQGDGLIDTHYRSMTGVGYGFSAQNPKETFSIGYFGYSTNIQDLKGQLNYSELIDTESRKNVFKDHSNNYEALGHNIGIVWQVAKKASPRFSLVMTDLEDTKLKLKGEPKEDVNSSSTSSTATTTSVFDSTPQPLFQQNNTLGFSISPQINKSSHINWVVEMTQIGLNDVSILKKFRSGLEYNLFGGTGSYAKLSARAGINNAGYSMGLMCNLGLINFEASSYAVDIGDNDSRMIERRFSGTVGINVGDF